MENKNTNIDILDLLSLEAEVVKNDTEKEENDVLNTFETTKLDNDILSNTNILLNTEEKSENTVIDIMQEVESNSKVELNFLSKIKEFLVFGFKYITTSTLIFAFLLSITNYSAYIEIARSYLNPDALEQNKMALLSSVNNSKIQENAQDEKKSIQEKVSMVKNKTYHSMDKLLNWTYDDSLNMQVDIVPYENRIIVPKIWKNIPLVEVENKTVLNVKELEDVFMKELEKWIVRYPGSSKPGEEWNTFIFWHSSNFPWIKWEYNDVFALLDNVVFWDEIIAYYGQKKYVYKVKEKKVIKPGDVSVLKRNTWAKEISLMTCWPVWTTLNRMIVVWELVSNN